VFDNIQDPGEQARDQLHQLTGITAIGPNQSQDRKYIFGPSEHKQRTVAVLKVAGMNDDHQEQAQRVNQDVPLTPRYLFTGVITTEPPFSVVLAV